MTLNTYYSPSKLHTGLTLLGSVPSSAVRLDGALITEKNVKKGLESATTFADTLSSNRGRVISFHVGQALTGPLTIETTQKVIDEIRRQMDSCRPSRIRNNGGQDLTYKPALKFLIGQNPVKEEYYRHDPEARAEVNETARTLPINTLLELQGVKIEGTSLILNQTARAGLSYFSPDETVSINGVLGLGIHINPRHVQDVFDSDGQKLFAGQESVKFIADLCNAS